MAYDVPSTQPWDRGRNSFFVSVRERDVAEITLAEALGRGDSPGRPRAPAAWAPLYGMLADRFGITWVVDVG